MHTNTLGCLQNIPMNILFVMSVYEFNTVEPSPAVIWKQADWFTSGNREAWDCRRECHE